MASPINTAEPARTGWWSWSPCSSQTQPGSRCSHRSGQWSSRSSPYPIQSVPPLKPHLTSPKHSRSRTTTRNRRIPRTPVPILPDPRTPTRPINTNRHPRLGRVARARRIRVARLAARRRQAEPLGRAAVAVLRAARRVPGTRVALVVGAAGLVWGDRAGIEEGR